MQINSNLNEEQRQKKRMEIQRHMKTKHIKISNIHRINFQKKKRKTMVGKKVFKAMSEDFSKLMNIYAQIQDQQKYDITVKTKKHRKPQIIRIL